MMYYGFGFVGMFFMIVFWIGFVLLIVWLIRQGINATHNGCCGSNNHRKSHSNKSDNVNNESHLDILNKRLAEGEITEKEYDSLKKKLGY